MYWYTREQISTSKWQDVGKVTLGITRFARPRDDYRGKIKIVYMFNKFMNIQADETATALFMGNTKYGEIIVFIITVPGRQLRHLVQNIVADKTWEHWDHMYYLHAHHIWHSRIVHARNSNEHQNHLKFIITIDVVLNLSNSFVNQWVTDPRREPVHDNMKTSAW